MTQHVLSLLVEDKPGILTRVAALFARRGYNIQSLAVGTTEVEGVSRMTVVVSLDGQPLEQVTKQLNKLVNVLKIVELENDNAVARDHMLVKVRTDATTRSQVLEAVTLFRARVIDVVSDSVVIEVTGDSAKCQAFIKVLEPFGIKELVQSGAIAISRGSKSMSEKVLR
ncbi:MAG: acetolactate synthase small subunit [Aquiluna sp.]|mgnify:FL=1|jgi:acetolactate synthase I/III small subunit|uniref:acetolactate synthase small subunit n=1 Tax=Aquiluna sp. TaxID=2053504 RepID=UPI00276D103A|nr:acetolactate synthase small subunit [Aquiluna sp.]